MTPDSVHCFVELDTLIIKISASSDNELCLDIVGDKKRITSRSGQKMALHASIQKHNVEMAELLLTVHNYNNGTTQLTYFSFLQLIKEGF